MALPPSGKRVTIRDVARFAHVSHQTVSRFINDGNHIAPWTRTRVEQAIAKLGFRPSHIARSLVTRRTKTVGLVMGDVASPFFPDVARGAEDVLAPAGYSLILSSSRRDPERELRNVRHLLERSTDGLILGAPQCPPEELAELAAASRHPDGVPQPRGGRAPRRGRLDRLAERHDRGRDVPGRARASTHRADRPGPERRPGREPGGLVPARAGQGRPRPRAVADPPRGHVARGRVPGGRAAARPGAPPDGGHLSQRRDGDRSPAGLRPAQGFACRATSRSSDGTTCRTRAWSRRRSRPCGSRATSSARRRPVGCSI